MEWYIIIFKALEERDSTLSALIYVCSFCDSIGRSGELYWNVLLCTFFFLLSGMKSIQYPWPHSPFPLLKAELLLIGCCTLLWLKSYLSIYKNIYVCVCVCVCVCACACLVTQSCLTFCDPRDCSLPGSSVHGILQAKILKWVPWPPPGDLPNLGIEPGPPALQMDSLCT